MNAQRRGRAPSAAMRIGVALAVGVLVGQAGHWLFDGALRTLIRWFPSQTAPPTLGDSYLSVISEFFRFLPAALLMVQVVPLLAALLCALWWRPGRTWEVALASGVLAAAYNACILATWAYGGGSVAMIVWPLTLLSVLGVVTGAAMAPVARYWWRWRDQRYLARLGGCQRCGYNLTGNVSGRCPECGLAFATDRWPRANR